MSLEEKVKNALNEVRPYLQYDGGDISLVEIKDGTVFVRLTGSCDGCEVNQMTLKAGVEFTIKKHAPEIAEVVNIS